MAAQIRMTCSIVVNDQVMECEVTNLSITATMGDLSKVELTGIVMRRGTVNAKTKAAIVETITNAIDRGARQIDLSGD